MITGFKSEGHSGVEGESVICAWVSAVTQMALIGIEEELHYPVRYNVDEPKGLLKVALDCAPDSHTQLLFKSMLNVLKQLSEGYPQDVRLKGHGGESNV